MENKKVNIKKISDKAYEVLNSPFYVDGKGGQLGDRGTISDANIIEVKENLVILDKDLEDGEYTYFIDEKRREDISQQHTAQHIFSAEAYNNFFHNNYSSFTLSLSLLSNCFISTIGSPNINKGAIVYNSPFDIELN